MWYNVNRVLVGIKCIGHEVERWNVKMKNERWGMCLFIIAITCVICGACGKKVLMNNDNDFNEKNEIIAFYESMVKLNESVQDDSYSINNELLNLSIAINRFELVSEKEELEYKDYFSSIQSNKAYISLKEEFLENAKEDLEDPLIFPMYAALIETYTEIILDTDLPFENELQIKIPNSTATFRYKDLFDRVIAAQNKIIKEGLDIQVDYQDNGAFSHTEKFFHDTSSGRIYIYPEFFYDRDGKILMHFVSHSEDDWFDFANKAKFTNGDLTATINSTQILYGMIRFYSTEWEDSMNNEYSNIQDIFEKPGDVLITVNDNTNLQLTQEEVKLVSYYLKMMDTVKKMYETVEE